MILDELIVRPDYGCADIVRHPFGASAGCSELFVCVLTGNDEWWCWPCTGTSTVYTTVGAEGCVDLS